MRDTKFSALQVPDEWKSNMTGLIEYVKDRTETNLLPHLLVMIGRICL